MNQNTDIAHEAKKYRLLAAALELQHFTSAAAHVVPIPGTGSVIAIGTPAQVAQLLGGVPARAGDLMTVDCPACDGSAGCDECSGQGQLIVSRADMGVLHADHADSEGGHHD